jgi:hypothetical protein
VSANFHAVRLREADDFIALAEIECAGVPPHDPPLHHILRLDHVEFASQRCRVSSLGKQGWTNGSAHQQMGLVGCLPQPEGRRHRGCD